MFKKGPDIDKKKLLLKASDVKKDSLTRLKHFKTLIEHLDFNEVPLLFRSHFSFIYHTFIDTFSTFDCNSKQRRDDLDCILFMLEKILIYNPELIKKRWQFYSITFVMQKLLHINNTWIIRQEGVRLFVIWYQILCDESNVELQTIFASLVPRIIPKESLFNKNANNEILPPPIPHQDSIPSSQNLPNKLCSIDPLVPMTSNEQPPNDEISLYLDSLLQFIVTQTTKPHWSSPDEARKNQELSFSFMFSMFKKVYLGPLFPNYNSQDLATLKSNYLNHSNIQYVDESGDSPSRTKRDPLQIDLKQSKYLQPVGPSNQTSNEYERQLTLSSYQAIVIRWLTRVLRQEMILGQDEFIKAGGSAERQNFQSFKEQSHDQEFSYGSDGNSTTIFQNMETTSREMEIARKVIGTWPENITVIHELFRRAFLNYFQPASMKRVVNVYKEWICNGGPNQTNSRLGYTSFGDLLQVFVLNSSNAFVTRVHNPAMLDEQVEMCKRIMNIYRYMVMKIYMNASTWEQLLNVMLSITEHLFPLIPPERKESTIGGRIAPAFFQTFIVSWIRANLYVHISNQMWTEFHRVMKNLIRWRELIEEWSTTMSSLTRVLVKHLYGLNLTDLPLEKPQDRRRRPKALKSLSTAESTQPSEQQIPVGQKMSAIRSQVRRDQENPSARPQQATSSGLNVFATDPTNRGLARSNSDGFLFLNEGKLYHSSFRTDSPIVKQRIRRVKSEYFLLDTGLDVSSDLRSSSPTHNDVIDGSSLKDPNMFVDNEQKSHKSNSDRCVLLGGNVRGWTSENSVVMWRRMLGLFGNINQIEDPDNHLVAMRCLAVTLCDFIKTRENMGISIDNQSTPDQPSLIPPYNFYIGWILEATHLPRQFKESRLTAYKLLCLMSIRRHDIELPQQYYSAFFEALNRGLNSPDPQVHASIVKNSTQLLSLELPGSTILVQGLFERSRSLLLNTPKEITLESSPRDQAIQILNTILSLHRPLKKLMVLKPDANNPMNLIIPGDIKAKIFDTFLACNMRPIVLDTQTRSRSLCSMTLYVYQELCDKNDNLEVEKLFDTILTDLQDSSNGNQFRINCDLLRLFSEYAIMLTQSRPALVSSVIQILCQLVVRLSTNESNKEAIYCLLICLEDWCIAVGKNYLLKPVEQMSTEEDDNLSTCLSESLVTIVLRSLENVIHDEQYIDEFSNKGTRGSTSTSKGGSSDGRSNSHNSDSCQLGIQSSRTTNNDNPVLGQQESTHEDKSLKAIKLACRVTHQKLVTYLGHFPFRQVGPASMSCCVNEADYLSNEQELSDLKGNSDICLLVIDGTTIISFLGSQQQGPFHLIIRNLCGRYSWDANCIDLEPNQCLSELEKNSIAVDPDAFQQDDSRASMKYDSDFNEDGASSSSLSSRSSTNRDFVGDLLNQLSSLMTANGSSSLSSGRNSYKKRNCAQSISNPKYRVAQAEETMIALLTNQRFQELNYCERSDDFDRVVLNFGHFKYQQKQSNDEHSSGSQSLDSVAYQFNFEQCRQLIQQLGYLTWEKRFKVDSLNKSARLLRELKNLDAQPSRETHKIAVIYVAIGQEDKNSILTNSCGSRTFEDFVSALGWEVNLSSHLGFKGGLQSNKSTGETSPYYCNSTTEVMFHVSTRIPINGPADDESLNRKLRHLGNDEIHIVWSEHTRDYRRGIIPTEFGDVIIAIYPMLTFHGYYRIQVSSKPDVPLFGPLFDNCIVHQTSLAPLVRATAINASRAKRLKLPYYQSQYEERSRLIDTIVKNHKEKLSFEDFAAQLYQTTSVIRNNNYQNAQGNNQDTSCCA